MINMSEVVMITEERDGLTKCGGVVISGGYFRLIERSDSGSRFSEDHLRSTAAISTLEWRGRDREKKSRIKTIT